MQRAFLALFVLLALSASLPGAVLAHPHVFVDSDIVIVFDEQGLAGFRQTWTFDDMFSALILEDFDTDADGALSGAEVDGVRDGAFANTKQWNYFTRIVIDGKDFPVQWVNEFTARVDRGRLQYQFFTPCHVAASGQARTVTVAVFDPDYYADFLPPFVDDVVLEGAEGLRLDLDQYQDPGAAFSQWMIVPTLLKVSFSRP